ncbi:MAG: hypothetical protein ILO34_08035 [Kiritimatiellae bacterium]|nr:hypothetical protein [Kiritimatiellia bacterium]
MRTARLLAISAACAAITAAAAEKEMPMSDLGHGASVTWRVLPMTWMDEDSFGKLVELFSTNRITGKIALFTCPYHVPATFEEMEKECALLKQRMPVLKQMGYEVGINHLCTVGHVNEDLEHGVKLEGVQHFTGIDGSVAPGNYCLRDEAWRAKYVRPVYKMLAQTGPDFIWTDDDLRLGYHSPAVVGCFCEVCMEYFKERFGCPTDLVEFQRWIDEPGASALRRLQFLQENRKLHADILRDIAETVRGVDPSITIGTMQTECHFDGYPFPEQFRALDGENFTLYWRPGAGVYDDMTPDQILLKANSIGRLCAYIPDSGRCKVECEIENFNYQRLNKSEHMAGTESLVYTLAGCMGSAYNVLGYCANDPVDVNASLAAHLESIRPRLDAYAAAAGRGRPQGVWDCRTRDLFAAQNYHGGWFTGPCSPFLGADKFSCSELLKSGIPPAHRFDEALVCAPNADALWLMNDYDLDKMFERGVYLDRDALEVLVARGRVDDIGFEIAGEFNAGAYEQMLPHFLAGNDAGMIRDARQSFWGGRATALKPVREGALAATRLVDTQGAEWAACASGTYENRRGGRVFVNGYFAYDRMFFRHKTMHMKRVFDWLAGGRMGYICSYHRAALWIRGDLVGVFNMSADTAKNLEVALPASSGNSFRLLGEDGEVKTREQDGKVILTFPEIPAWDVKAVSRK